VIAWFALAGVFAILVVRRGFGGEGGTPSAAHLVGLSVAGVGLIAMATLNHRLFGQWGGLGGWYFWAWIPWLVLATRPAIPRTRTAIALLGAFVIVANASWFIHAARLYGW
jgi:hypothetical protein